jgi:hypothetical protein
MGSGMIGQGVGCGLLLPGRSWGFVRSHWLAAVLLIAATAAAAAAAATATVITVDAVASTASAAPGETTQE